MVMRPEGWSWWGEVEVPGKGGWLAHRIFAFREKNVFLSRFEWWRRCGVLAWSWDQGVTLAGKGEVEVVPAEERRKAWTLEAAAPGARPTKAQSADQGGLPRVTWAPGEPMAQREKRIQGWVSSMLWERREGIGSKGAIMENDNYNTGGTGAALFAGKAADAANGQV